MMGFFITVVKGIQEDNGTCAYKQEMSMSMVS